MAANLSIEEIASELAACEVTLPPPALEKLSVYLDLLVRWNQRINLTGLREPRLIVRRLFGESLYLGKILDLKGWLVDVGSGAGFPGLALKLATPELQVSLVEPRHRKAAFLKEVVRECGLTIADVVINRFEPWAEGLRERLPDFITTRAVDLSEKLLSSMARALAPEGTVALLTTRKIANSIRDKGGPFSWRNPIMIPFRDGSVVLVGGKTESSVL